MSWLVDLAVSGEVHVHPEQDLVEHNVSGVDCVCVPLTEAVPREDGSYGWLLVHQSLDNREAREAEHG